MEERTFQLNEKDADVALKLFTVAKIWGQYVYKAEAKKGNAPAAILSLSIVANADEFINRIKQWQDGNK